MVGGSGLLLTARAAESEAPPRRHPLAVAAVVALIATTSCVYFNAYYNASRTFERGLRQVEEGRRASARADLVESIEKAERIVQENPNSRWADDALLIMVRGRLLLEDWELAAEASRSLFTYADTHGDSARAAGYLGTAELHRENLGAADSLLSLALSEDSDRRRRAELLHARGLSRWGLGRLEAAQADFEAVSEARPELVEPRLDLARLLAERGLGEEAAFTLATVLELNLNEAEQVEVLSVVEDFAEQDRASALLALASAEEANLIRARRSQLLRMRGELWVAAGDVDRGRADYRAAAAMAPGERASAEAELEALRLDLQMAGDVDQFRDLAEDLERLAETQSGRRSVEVRRLNETFARMSYWLDVGRLGYMIAGETARDVLAAPRLARHLFLRYAEAEAESAWAAKAILAALDLGDLHSPAGDEDPASEASAAELRGRLRENYRDSPYVRAVLGESPEGPLTYEELEAALERQLERLSTLADQRVQQQREAAIEQ
jgi:hypothetical protein